MLESTLTTAIMRYLRAQGYWVRKNVGGRFGITGIPDVEAIKDGRVLFFEVKTADGVLSPLQQTRIAELRRFGAMAEVVRSVEDVRTLIQGET